MLNTRSTTNTLSDAASENHPGAAVDPDPPLPIAINYRAFLVMILAFDIPTFHASLATRAEDSVFGEYTLTIQLVAILLILFRTEDRCSRMGGSA